MLLFILQICFHQGLGFCSCLCFLFSSNCMHCQFQMHLTMYTNFNSKISTDWSKSFGTVTQNPVFFTIYSYTQGSHQENVKIPESGFMPANKNQNAAFSLRKQWRPADCVKSPIGVQRRDARFCHLLVVVVCLLFALI